MTPTQQCRWSALCFTAMLLAAVSFDPCTAFRGTGALSIPTVQHSASSINNVGKRSSRLGMAFTEDVQKVNGDSTSPPPPATAASLGSIGDNILNSVTSLAQSAGNPLATSGQQAGDGGPSDDRDTISSAFTGKEPTSRRSELIKWQRENSVNARKATARLLSTGEMTVGNREDGSRLTKLVAILPSSKKDAANNNANGSKEKDQSAITTALQTLEKDMTLLDNLASMESQLSGTEAGLLIGAVVASGIGPILFPGTSVTEVLAPAAAAFVASITIGSEYIGRVAVSDGKEIAANAIQCAAEAEALLANAERVKAITPLCVGVGATGASLTLLTPTIIEALGIAPSAIFITELYLVCPLVCVLAAAVCNLALEETKGFAERAIRCGIRRFSKSNNVGRAWVSVSEEVQAKSESRTNRWWMFTGSVLPAPIIGSFLGGPSLSAKCIVVAALAAAQSAYYLAEAEGVIARAADAVALKARSAAVCDTYANQGVRNSAILPFTSALSAFCAAATATAVELPFVETMSGLYGTFGEVAAVSTFPILSSAFAAAGAVSKARCEVDAEAAAQAASTLALEYDGADGDPVLRPFKEVWKLVKLAVTSGWTGIKKTPFGNIWKNAKSAILGFRSRKSNNDGSSTMTGGEALSQWRQSRNEGGGMMEGGALA